MNKEFIPYEQALALKELGFDEPCFGNWQDMKEINPWLSNSYTISQNQYYGQLCSAPTYSAAFRWFREKHGMHHTIQYDGKEYIVYTHNYHKTTKYKFDTYEEAEQACLDKLIEIVKNEQNK